MSTIHYKDALRELQEMFPNHPKPLIEQILKDQNYKLDATISILLNSDPNQLPRRTSANANLSPPQRTYQQPYNYSQPPPQRTYQQQYYNPPSTQERTYQQYQNPRPAQVPKPAAPAIPQHIFPADFLRWPSFTKTIKVNISEPDAALPASVKSSQSSISSESEAQFQMNDLSVHSEVENHGASGWAKFKARFSKKAQYQQI